MLAPEPGVHARATRDVGDQFRDQPLGADAGVRSRRSMKGNGVDTEEPASGASATETRGFSIRISGMAGGCTGPGRAVPEYALEKSRNHADTFDDSGIFALRTGRCTSQKRTR